MFPVANYSGQVQPHGGPSFTGGSDIFAPIGTAVLNMVKGTVMSVGHNAPGDPGGNWVLIKGIDGLEYYYAHLKDTPLVNPGQTLSPGAQLGAVGKTGNASTLPDSSAHLHIGIGPTISTGVGAPGGLGVGFNAVALLNSVLSAVGAPTIPVDNGTSVPGDQSGVDVGNAIGNALIPEGGSLLNLAGISVPGIGNILGNIGIQLPTPKILIPTLQGYLLGLGTAQGAPLLFAMIGGTLVLIGLIGLAVQGAGNVASQPGIRETVQKVAEVAPVVVA